MTIGGNKLYLAYRRDKLKFTIISIILIILLVLFVGIGIGVGPYSISLGDVYSIIINHIFCNNPIDTVDDGVVWNLRLPRVLTAVVAGIGLAVAGSAMQNMLKNPLADPYTTGISSGACLGATIAITLGWSIVKNQYGIVINAFVVSLIPTLILLLITKYKRATPETVILIGVTLMFLFDAITALIMLKADPNSMAAAYEWTIGTLNKASWDTIFPMFIFVFPCSLLIFSSSRALDTLNSGESFSKSLGINVNKMRISLLVILSIMVAGIISFTGVIGFIGLISPHIARMLIGSKNMPLFISSALVGALLMVIADIISKTISTSTLPIGIVAVMLGAPIFVIIYLKNKRGMW
ncbi:MAG: iron ABC transporter permease [Bacteroidales bacterium]|nr:iron ABC transporter permease [Bacteroidales bacterium]